MLTCGKKENLLLQQNSLLKFRPIQIIQISLILVFSYQMLHFTNLYHLKNFQGKYLFHLKNYFHLNNFTFYISSFENLEYHLGEEVHHISTVAFFKRLGALFRFLTKKTIVFLEKNLKNNYMSTILARPI